MASIAGEGIDETACVGDRPLHLRKVSAEQVDAPRGSRCSAIGVKPRRSANNTLIRLTTYSPTPT
jgi:hypothetical protein